MLSLITEKPNYNEGLRHHVGIKMASRDHRLGFRNTNIRPQDRPSIALIPRDRHLGVPDITINSSIKVDTRGDFQHINPSIYYLGLLVTDLLYYNTDLPYSVTDLSKFNKTSIFYNSKEDSTISRITELLTEGQFEMFKKTVFGKFLDIPHYAPFRHRRVCTDIRNAMHCIQREINLSTVTGGLYDTYFSRFRLSRQEIRSQFIYKVWKNDEDAMKFAKLHLLANFLLGTQDTLLLDRRYLDIIDSDECEEYAWGKEVFEFTVHYLKKTLPNWQKMHTRGDKEKSEYLFRCYGFILALQIWFYEICDTANGLICTRSVGEDVPRMLRWEVKGTHNRSKLQRHFMNLPHDKFNNLSPTTIEKSSLNLNGFFKKRNEFLGGNLVAPSHDQFVSDGPNNDKGGANAGHPQSKEVDDPVGRDTDVGNDPNLNAMKGKTDEAINQNAMNDTSHDVAMNQCDGVAILAKPMKPPVLNPVIATSYKRNVIKNSSPFNVPFWKNIFEVDTEDFMRWLRMGMLRTYQKIREHEFEHYLKRFRPLKPPFDFNVHHITDKNWFMTLVEPGSFLDDTSRVFNVDHILFPIHIDLNGVGHWVLGRLSIGERRLVAYNSLRSEEFDKILYDGVRCYSTLIPIFLGMVHFYSKRTDINSVGEAFDGKGVNDPLDVIMAENLPQQEQGDCGIFVASFAEYFITKFDLPTDYLPDTERMRYSYELYQHGRMKQKHS
ncbi:sentrin-specific protease 1 [Striga asiatica]|uniref:Sentrin-specific protease 1 n=1 Tax=Striga asiatica TaxID=4170 RepID=A0A5A7PI13_STRAF|nr:sentrin-specific protease 1 [Striga asiatica]